MADFNAAAVRFGKPGKIYIANPGTAEPAAVNDPWPAGWTPLGYTDEGSAFNYEISTDNVEVAEELDVLARVTTGRDASVEFALAEMTYRNLAIAFNGGIIVADGQEWEFEPVDIGDEVRVAIGWDASKTVASNDLRFIFRQCFNGGSLSIENRKGVTKSTLGVNFQLEKPANGQKILRIVGGGNLNPLP